MYVCVSGVERDEPGGHVNMYACIPSGSYDGWLAVNKYIYIVHEKFEVNGETEPQKLT